MRIITGALAFFESSAGIAIETAPLPLLPKPPPVYSQIRTTSAWIDADPASDDGHVKATLWVEPCRYSLPFCQ